MNSWCKDITLLEFHSHAQNRTLHMKRATFSKRTLTHSHIHSECIILIVCVLAISMCLINTEYRNQSRVTGDDVAGRLVCMDGILWAGASPANNVNMCRRTHYLGVASYRVLVFVLAVDKLTRTLRRLRSICTRTDCARELECSKQIRSLARILTNTAGVMRESGCCRFCFRCFESYT